jgi:hypothetical protein
VPRNTGCKEVGRQPPSPLLPLTERLTRCAWRVRPQPEEAAETLNDHRQRTTYEPTTKALPERTLRFGTAKEFALETAAVDGSYSKPTYVFMPRI